MTLAERIKAVLTEHGGWMRGRDLLARVQPCASLLALRQTICTMRRNGAQIDSEPGVKGRGYRLEPAHIEQREAA